MSDIRIQNRLLLPQRQALDLAAVAKTMAGVDLSGLYPQNELWEITVVRGQSRYDVRNAVGAKMSRVPAVGPAANRLQVGQVAIVGYYERDRRRPYIKAAGGFANWEQVQILLGIWQQAEGNCYLSQSGQVNIFPVPTLSGAGQALFFSLGLNSEEETGMAQLLGMAAGSGSDPDGETNGVGTLYFVAFLVPNSGNTAIVSMQVRAYELFPGFTQKWSVDIPYSASIPTNRRFRANLFWDKKARVLTVAEGKIWSILVPATGTPTRYATSNVNASYSFSAAGEFGLAWPPGVTVQVYRRNSNLTWNPVGSGIPMTDFGSLIQSTNVSAAVSRPWPFDPVDLSFRLIWQAANRIDKIVTVGRNGSTSSVNIGTLDTGQPDVEFSAALEAGDDYMENSFDYDSNTFIPQGADAIGPDFTGFPAYYDVDLGAGPIPFQEHLWGGRQDFGRLFIPYPPTDLDTFTIWYYNENTGSGGGHNANPFPVSGPNAGPENMGYLCPRSRSNDSTPDPDSTYTVARWPEQLEPQSDSAATMTPCLQQDSAGNLIYAKICSIRASVPNPRPTFTAFQKPGEATDNGLGGTIIYHQATYTFYHWPRQEFIHETFLLRASKAGGLEQLSLSNRFSGFTYTNSDLPISHFPVELTETLAVPENVWDIKMGPLQVEGQDDTAWTDTVYVLQDWREAADVAPRLRLQVVSKAWTKLGSLDELSPLDEVDGEYEWVQSAARMFVNIGTLYQWALIAVYSDNIADSAIHRVDLHLVDLSNLSAPTIVTSLNETGTQYLPRPEDFDRFTATSSGIFWIQRDPGDSLHKFWSLLHT